MGFLSKLKSKKLPKGHVQDWSREDVRKWVKFIGMDRYKQTFQGYNGRNLTQLTKEEIAGLIGPSRITDVDILFDNVTELRQKFKIPEPVTAEPINQQPQPTSYSAPPQAPSIVVVQVPGATVSPGPEENGLIVEIPDVDEETKPTSIVPFSVVDTNTRSPAKSVKYSPTRSLPRTPVSPSPRYSVSQSAKELITKPLSRKNSENTFKDEQAPTPTEVCDENFPPQSAEPEEPYQYTEDEFQIADTTSEHLVLPPSEVASPTAYSRNAEIMSKWAGGASRLQELTNYFDQIGIGGHGLVTAAESSPIVGMIVGALWDLHDATLAAKGNRQNCYQLDDFGQDVLRIFDFRGKQTANIETHKLQHLFDLVCEVVRVVANCSRPGWLLRMACDEKSIEDFGMLHLSILELLRSVNLDQLCNQRRLVTGNYLDASKPLRRKLKQLGAGSVEGGLRAAKASEPNLNEIVRLINVDEQEIAKELESVTNELDDLATIYTKTVEGSAVEEQLYIRECEDIFDTYDRNRTGSLEFGELRAVLGDLGFLDGMTASEGDAFVLAKFNMSTTNSNINFENFCQFYKNIKMSRARHELRTTLGVQTEYDLKKTFINFASFGTRQMLEEMDSARFMKLCKDAKLLGKNLTSSDIDLIFVKAKPKGQRKINFEQFVQCLSSVADKKSKSLDEVVNAVLACRGPTNTGTKAEYVKFHDDKSTYTGVYARGGPSTIDPKKDLSAYLDRSEADIRGVKKFGDCSTPMSRSSMSFPFSHSLISPIITPTSSQAVSSPRFPPGSARSRGTDKNYTPIHMQMKQEFHDLESVFKAFSVFGAGPQAPGKALEMDGLRFAKLCRDCDLMDSRLNSSNVDIVFSKIKQMGARKITFKEFRNAVDLLAEIKGMTTDAITEAMCACKGPVVTGTRAEPNRFYDDRLPTQASVDA